MEGSAYIVLQLVCGALGHLGVPDQRAAIERARAHAGLVEWQAVDEMMKQVPQASCIRAERAISLEHHDGVDMETVGLQDPLAHIPVANQQRAPVCRPETMSGSVRAESPDDLLRPPGVRAAAQGALRLAAADFSAHALRRWIGADLGRTGKHRCERGQGKRTGLPSIGNHER